MRIAVFDPWCGVSGNMVLGALLDAGVSLESLREMLSGLGLDGWEISCTEVVRGCLRGKLVHVTAPEGEPARHLSDILDLLSGSDLPEDVKVRASGAFEILAAAEAKVHGIGVEEVHFHEVGAMDAIIDITGAFCGLHLLGVEEVHSAPVSTGTGTLQSAHGILPVPAPATLGILSGIPVSPSGIPFEITTPTGAAILASAVTAWETTPPPFRVGQVGYGAGDRELTRPNLIRVTVGETIPEAPWDQDRCIEVRTVIDDMDPRRWPDLSREVLEAGAVDCYASMCIGRKGRPALEAVVICHEDRLDDVLSAAFRHSTTLGARIGRFGRAVLKREHAAVSTEYGEIGVKRSYLAGELLHAEPEYGECSAAARRHGVPVSRVLTAARLASEAEDAR
ncbi:MAG: hypothetical protein AVO35_02340 [Candidatus Aegiribacteria sp. MLS_C]|nr:MAG: hypothetical protein AVO35_02340 [Candidatus Aegiribacteria sp. MLS_C]